MYIKNKHMKKTFIYFILLLASYSNIYAFDHQHIQWNQLLLQTVHYSINGFSSRVDYKQLKNQSEHLNAYLSSLSDINPIS